jgi:autotransporter-associated beta strand protein
MSVSSPEVTLRTAQRGSFARAFLQLGLLAATLTGALLLPAQPINGTWTSATSGGAWTDTTKWANGIVAGGAGSIADFSTINPSGVTITINANAANVTVGQILIGDTDNTNAVQLTLAPGFALTFDNNGAGALFYNVPSASNTAITGAVLLADDLTVHNAKTATNRFLEFRGDVSASSAGLKTITFNGTTPGNFTTFIAGASISDGAGQVGIVQSGAKTLQLYSVNTYTGGTRITNGGTVAITADTGLGAASSTLTFNNGTLSYIPAVAGAILARDIALESGGGTISLSTSTTNNTVNATGNISGVGGLTKTGSAALTLSGINTYEGGTTINQGNILISSDENLGAASGGITLNGGNLQFAASITTARPIVTTSTTSGGFSTNSAADAIVWTGDISGPGRINKSGSGKIHLQGNNTYEGGTFITNGTLHATTDANLGAPTGTLSLGSTTASAMLDMRSTSNSTRNVVLTGNATIGVSFSLTTSTWNGTFSGAGTLIKAYSGNLVLNGTGNYTGGTTVNAGTLTINGNFTTATGNYTVNAGKLNVNGQIAAPVAVQGGALSGSGRINSTVSIAAAGRLAFTLASSPAAHQPLLVDQAVTFESGATLELNGTDVPGGNTWTLVTAGSFTGPLPQLALPEGWQGSLAVVGQELRFTLDPFTTATQAWRELNFGSTEITELSAATADPDQDGWTNLVEYALGLDPLEPDGIAALTQGIEDGYLTLTFNSRATPDLTYSVEAADTLGTTWSSIWTRSSDQNTDGPVKVVDTVPVNSRPARFLRLHVETAAW